MYRRCFQLTSILRPQGRSYKRFSTIPTKPPSKTISKVIFNGPGTLIDKFGIEQGKALAVRCNLHGVNNHLSIVRNMLDFVENEDEIERYYIEKINKLIQTMRKDVNPYLQLPYFNGSKFEWLKELYPEIPQSFQTVSERTFLNAFCFPYVENNVRYEEYGLPVPHAVDALKYLKKMGIRAELSMYSQKTARNLQYIFNKHGITIEDYPAQEYTPNDNFYRISKICKFSAIIEASTGSNPTYTSDDRPHCMATEKTTVSVESTRYGINNAKLKGYWTVGVYGYSRYGFDCSEKFNPNKIYYNLARLKLEQAKPDFLIKDLSELPFIIQRINA